MTDKPWRLVAVVTEVYIYLVFSGIGCSGGGLGRLSRLGEKYGRDGDGDEWDRCICLGGVELWVRCCVRDVCSSFFW